MKKCNFQKSIAFQYIFVELFSLDGIEKSKLGSNPSTFANFCSFFFIAIQPCWYWRFYFHSPFSVHFRFSRAHIVLYYLFFTWSSRYSSRCPLIIIIDKNLTLWGVNFQCHVWLIHNTWLYYHISPSSHLYSCCLALFALLSMVPHILIVYTIVHISVNTLFWRHVLSQSRNWFIKLYTPLFIEVNKLRLTCCHGSIFEK